MITPRFSLTQNETFLTITIRAPYCSLKDIEIYIDKDDFRFICSPYYLRLNLPGEIIQNDASTGEYLTDTGEFVLKYEKTTPGEHFDGLDFITSLLSGPTKREFKSSPQIEVLSSETNEDEPPDDGDNWFIEQKLPDELDTLLNTCKYGFASQKSNFLANTEDEYYSVFDVRNADKMPVSERKNLRFDTESMHFSAEHYLADYFDDSSVKEIVQLKHPWLQFDKTTVKFNDREKDILKDLPNKDYLLSESEINDVLYGLIDILYAYCYDKRTTDFEGSCESGWTITKLTSTLSWFDIFDSEKDALVSAFRRSLIYPLYRNFELSTKVLDDLRVLFQLGPVFIIKSLLDIYDVFNGSAEPRYILNELYIKDYIIYMQKCPNKYLDRIRNEVNEIQVKMEDVKLDLETIVKENLNHSGEEDDLTEKMSNLNMLIQTLDSDSSDSDDDSSSSEDSSSDDDDTSSSEDSN